MKIKFKVNSKKNSRAEIKRADLPESYSTNAYAAIEDELYEETSRERSPLALRNNVVAYCEQMLEASQELEDSRSEYKMVIGYLNDILLYEELEEQDKSSLKETANRILALNRARGEFLRTDKRLSDNQFALIQEQEEDMPSVIRRMEKNEQYLNSVEKDMHSLEGEKVEWDIVKEECLREQKVLRTISLLLFILVVSIVLGLMLLGYVMEVDLKLAVITTLFLTALMGSYLLFRYQDSTKEIQRSAVNRNYATTLENRVKIKYVNIKNALDYTCEKYHVTNSKQLSYFYQQYQQVLKEKEQFQQMNEELIFYEEQLGKQISDLWLKQGRGWASYATALANSSEMEKLKQDFMDRRKKLKQKIEYNTEMILDTKQSIQRNLPYMGGERGQIEEILKRIEEITQKMV